MDGYTLPPELEQFAAEVVAAGRYRDRAEVVDAAFDLLRQQEKLRAEFAASVVLARERAEREGCLTGGEVAERVRATIARKAPALA